MERRLRVSDRISEPEDRRQVDRARGCQRPDDDAGGAEPDRVRRIPPHEGELLPGVHEITGPASDEHVHEVVVSRIARELRGRLDQRGARSESAGDERRAQFHSVRALGERDPHALEILRHDLDRQPLRPPGIRCSAHANSLGQRARQGRGAVSGVTVSPIRAPRCQY